MSVVLSHFCCHTSCMPLLKTKFTISIYLLRWRKPRVTKTCPNFNSYGSMCSLHFLSHTLVPSYCLTVDSQWRSWRQGGGRREDGEGERRRRGGSASFCIGATVDFFLGILRGILYHCNSYPRSRHVEPDAQVTHRALCLLHNAPAHLQGRKKE